MPIRMYWNNICLITKLEEAYLRKKCALSSQEISITYFGLGRETSLLSHLESKNFLDCDILVSTDTDIFQDFRFSSLFHRFSPYSKLITIPLVILFRKDLMENLPIPKSFEDLLDPIFHGKVCFGGRENSAGKSLVKSLWYQYGQEKTKEFVSHCRIKSMPSAAFQAVHSGECPIAILPTIFSYRRGISQLEMVWPEEGAIPIHSYIAQRSSLPDDVSHFILEELLGSEMQSFLMDKAMVIPWHKDLTKKKNSIFPNHTLLDPSWEFLHSLDHKKVKELLHL